MPARILTSIHGRRFGLDHDGKTIHPAGIVIGQPGVGIQNRLAGVIDCAIFDDFLDGFNTSRWLATEGTDSATSAAAILAGGIGGVLRLTTGDAGTGYAADAEQITQNHLMWQASEGRLAIEVKIALSQITEAYAFIGFTDTIALEAPITSAGAADTLTTNASDAVGWMFDTRMSTDNWWLTGVKADVDATAQNSGFAPVAATYQTLRVEVNASGVATFFRNGLQVGTAMSNALTAATDLTPIVTYSKLSTATSITADIDYIHVAKLR